MQSSLPNDMASISDTVMMRYDIKTLLWQREVITNTVNRPDSKYFVSKIYKYVDDYSKNDEQIFNMVAKNENSITNMISNATELSSKSEKLHKFYSEQKMRLQIHSIDAWKYNHSLSEFEEMYGESDNSMLNLMKKSFVMKTPNHLNVLPIFLEREKLPLKVSAAAVLFAEAVAFMAQGNYTWAAITCAGTTVLPFAYFINNNNKEDGFKMASDYFQKCKEPLEKSLEIYKNLETGLNQNIAV